MVHRFTTSVAIQDTHLTRVLAKQAALEYEAWFKDVRADYLEEFPLCFVIPTSTGCRIEDIHGTVLEEVDYEQDSSGY